MARTRERAKGRRGGDKERFARIPVSVLECEAVRTLDHAAFRVLVVVAAGFWGGNNGALALTPRYADRFGLTSRDTLYKALRELVRRGLLIETRQGWRGVKNHFALYALAWADINNREGQPLTIPEMCAPYLRKLYEWTESIPATGTDPVQYRTGHRSNSIPATGTEVVNSIPATGTDPVQYRTGHRSNSIPATGTEVVNSIPATGLESPISIPATGTTLRYLGGGDHLNGSHTSVSPAALPVLKPTGRTRGSVDLAALRFADALAIARADPTITADDLKARARCSLPEAHRALQQLQAQAAP